MILGTKHNKTPATNPNTILQAQFGGPRKMLSTSVTSLGFTTLKEIPNNFHLGV